ncbi:hypothetical protein EON64_04875, partial [archaeon]
DEDFARLNRLLSMQLASKNTVPCVQPFHSLVYPLSLQEMLGIARRYAHRARLGVALCELNFKYRAKSRSSRLRIGYVSSDFNNHPLAHLIQSLFVAHDTSKCEVFCYALSKPDGSMYRLRIEQEAEHFVDVSGMHAGEVAQLINSDNIHILIDLNGYTKGARTEIFALRPAPIQVSFMGFCGTMGADYIHYLVADNIVVPKQLRSFYQEKMLSMPHCYFLNDHRQACGELILPEVLETHGISRQRYGISEDKFVFCCFNQLYKIDPAIFMVWMRILKRVSNSVLWLLRFPTAGEANILREARAHGVREDQIIFSDVAPRDEHIMRGYLADLFLDTPACNAHTTACDILWSGTPLITMAGEKMASRVAASILGAIGLASQLVCSTFEGKCPLVHTVHTSCHDLPVLPFRRIRGACCSSG